MKAKKKKAKPSSRQTKRAQYNPADWDESRSVTVDPEPGMGRGLSTSIRLPRQMIAQLRKIARRKGGVGYQTLLKIWIAERIEKEIA